MLVRKIAIGDKEVTFAASARTPQIFRNLFPNQDLTLAMDKMDKKQQAELAKIPSDLSEEEKEKRKNAVLEKAIDVTLFEKIAFCMAYQADPKIGTSFNNWLDTFDDIFSLQMALPEIVDMIYANNATSVSPKKK